MIKYVVVKVRMSEVTTRQVAVPPWEVPILQAIHGDSVEVVDETVVDRELPDARDEYKRLADRYSRQKDENQSAVAQVYGLFEQGISKLEKAISEAETDEDADHKSAAESGKDERLKALKEKQKREAEQFKRRQEDELKQAERDAESRINDAERRDREEEERRRREELERTTVRIDPASLQRSPAAASTSTPAAKAKTANKGS
jgi:hypothetical protein